MLRLREPVERMSGAILVHHVSENVGAPEGEEGCRIFHICSRLNAAVQVQCFNSFKSVFGY